MNTVLVTGGAGFIGSNLCKKLLLKRKKVIAVDNFITSNKNNIDQLKKYKNFIFIKHDITQKFPNALLKKNLKISHIYHLACPTGVDNLEKMSQEMILTCSVGTQNILDLARFHKATVLFTSSSEVYGNPEIFPQNEKYTGNVSTIGIRSPYEEGKRFAECCCRMYVQKYNLNIKIVRIFNTYGPGMSLSDSRVIPHFIHNINQEKPIPIYGTGKNTRTFCYIEDLIEGLEIVMKKGERGEVYNLGSDQEITINELAQICIKLSRQNLPIKHLPAFKHDHNRRLPDLTKVQNLGWSPKTKITKGIKKTLLWYGL